MVKSLANTTGHVKIVFLVISILTLSLQVVVGVLGCPNLPQKRIEDEDGVAESASKAGTDGVGVIFAAETGQGAFAGPLSGLL